MDDETTPLQETILDQHAKLYDVRMECFDKVKKMADKVKMIENISNLFPRHIKR